MALRRWRIRMSGDFYNHLENIDTLLENSNWNNLLHILNCVGELMVTKTNRNEVQLYS